LREYLLGNVEKKTDEGSDYSLEGEGVSPTSGGGRGCLPSLDARKGGSFPPTCIPRQGKRTSSPYDGGQGRGEGEKSWTGGWGRKRSSTSSGSYHLTESKKKKRRENYVFPEKKKEACTAGLKTAPRKPELCNDRKYQWSSPGKKIKEGGKRSERGGGGGGKKEPAMSKRHFART